MNGTQETIKVRLLVSSVGSRTHHYAGDIVDVPIEEGTRLMSLGRAEALTSPVPEAAAVSPQNNAMRRPARPRKARK